VLLYLFVLGDEYSIPARYLQEQHQEREFHQKEGVKQEAAKQTVEAQAFIEPTVAQVRQESSQCGRKVEQRLVEAETA
jgi:hypothetical protein